MAEFGIIASLGTLVAVALLYLSRRDLMRASRPWILGWLAIYARGVLNNWPGSPAAAELPGIVLLSLFAGLLLCGALAFPDRRIERWPVVVGLALGALGALAAPLVGATTADLGLRVVQVPAALAAAVLVWRAGGAYPNAIAIRPLAVGYVAIAGLLIVEPAVTLMQLPRIPYLAAWAVVAVTVGLLQALAFIDLRRVREATYRATIERSAADLAQREQALRSLVESVPVGLALVDGEGRLRMLNRVACDQLGLPPPEQSAGRPNPLDGPALLERVVEEDRPRLREMARWRPRTPGAPSPRAEVRLQGEQLRRFEIEVHPVRSAGGGDLSQVWVSRDVTEERRLSERMRHAQRMETVGTLAGGVAHDFNNQLTAVVGNTRLVLDSLPPEDPRRDSLLDVERAAAHCAELTRGLLAFARREPAAPVAVDPAQALRGAESVLRSALPPGVELHVRVAPGTRPLQADPTQLQRALTNLGLNARDAVGSTGHLRLEAANHEGPAPPGARAESAHWVDLVVGDDGPGIDAATRERMFDPFFTTKPLGQGTGLGLSIVYGIAEGHGAGIEVSSAPGGGTEVRLCWPADGEAQSRIDGENGRWAQAGGSETILVAEDEASVRRLARRTLEQAGYEVVEAADGAEAVEQLEKHRPRVAMVVLDVAMPRLGGLEALARMRERVPGLPALLVTGNPTALEAQGEPACEVLPKPFTPATLARRVREGLDADAPGRPRDGGPWDDPASERSDGPPSDD